jgi:hypothetical protein
VELEKEEEATADAAALAAAETKGGGGGIVERGHGGIGGCGRGVTHDCKAKTM